jgi:hypothetical protein
MKDFNEFKELKSGEYKFKKKDWSIEEMVDLLESIGICFKIIKIHEYRKKTTRSRKLSILFRCCYKQFIY